MEEGTEMQNQADIVQLKLPTVLDLAAAEGFLDTMCRKVPAEGQMQLDASGVQTLTLPCVQILLAALQGGQVSIQHPSPAFVSAFEDLGLDCAGMEFSAPAESADMPAGSAGGLGQPLEQSVRQDTA